MILLDICCEVCCEVTGVLTSNVSAPVSFAKPTLIPMKVADVGHLKVEGDATGVTVRGVCPHAPVNCTVFFLCHGFIKFVYKNKILMKTRLSFLYITCYNVNYFVSQPVGLDFASGSGYENPMSQTPCCIM